jgi:hypothetical protein
MLIGGLVCNDCKGVYLSKHTYEYNVKNVSAQDSTCLHVIFHKDVSFASYLLGTHDNYFFREFLSSCCIESSSVNPEIQYIAA